MKAIKIILTIVLGLIILIFLGLYIFIKTFDINKQLPMLSKQASELIKRPVTIERGSLDLSLIHGLSLNLNGIAIADDPSFNQGSFLSLTQASIGLKLLPLLTKQQVHITRILLSSPKITIMRSAQGVLNIQSMMPAQEPVKAHVALNTSSTQARSSSNAVQTVPVIVVNAFIIENAEVLIDDAAAQFPMRLTIKNINVNVNGFSTVDPFDIKASLNVLAKGKSNIDISARCRLDASKNALNITSLKITSDLAQLDMKALKMMSSVLEGIPVWPVDVKGDLLVQESDFIASANGLEGFDLEILLNKGSVTLKELAVPLDRINLKAVTDLKTLTVRPLEAMLATGKLTVDGRIDDLLATPRLDFKIETKGIKLEEVLDQSAWPASLKGALNSRFSIAASSFDPVVMLKSLGADGDISLNDAKIERLNLLKMLLTKLSFIPGLEGVINASLPENIKKRINTETTLLDTVEAKIQVKNETLLINRALLESKGLFALTAQGRSSFDLTTSIDVTASLGNEISSSLNSSVRVLSSLLDDQGRLSIPGKLTGQNGNFMYTPQVGDLAKKALVSEGAVQLEKVLEKNPEVKNILNSILGGTSTAPENAQQNTEGKKEEPQTKDIINNVFNKFLK